MNWLSNATKKDADTITNVWPDLKIGDPMPKKLIEELKEEGLVGIYGNYPDVGKEKGDK